MRDNGIPYTLETPNGMVVFDQATRLFFEDIDFHANTRSEVSSKPQAHGSYRDAGFKEGGILSAKARLYGEGGLLESNRTQLVRALNSILGEGSGSGTGTLKWTNQGSGTQVQLSGLYLDDYAFNIDGTSWLIHLLLGCERSFAEDATATTTDSAALSETGGGFTIPLTIPITITPSSGGDMTLTNVGDFYAYPLFRAYGPIDDPYLINQTTDEYLVFDGSIASGDYWEIDMFEQTVKLNGATEVFALDVEPSTWWRCGFGETEVQLAGSGFTSQTFLRAYFRSAWG